MKGLRHRLILWGGGMNALFAAAAFYYSTILPSWLRLAFALGFPLFLLVALRLRNQYWRGVSATLLVVGFWGWYLNDPPRNDRDWQVEYSIPADAVLDGNIAHLQHVRDFAWHDESTFTPHWYDANYDIDTLSGVDMVTSYWAGESIAHVFLSFAFLDGRHLAISIETRRQKRFPYSVIAGFFHHYETFYVTADERDLIGVRTDFRRERVYLYHLKLTPGEGRRLFLNYLHTIHRLNTVPAWYNTLTDNCTTGILSEAQAGFPYRLDWRILLSGYTASLAWKMGFLDQRYSFPVLRRLSRVRRPVGATPGFNYSREIRQSLPVATSGR